MFSRTQQNSKHFVTTFPKNLVGLKTFYFILSSLNVSDWEGQPHICFKSQ